jgi:hypothetical protein
MQLNDGRARGDRSIELCRLGIDKQRCSNASFRELAAGVTHFIQLAGNIQTAFCGEFFTFFRDQAGIGWARRNCNTQHLLRYGTLKIHMRAHDLLYRDEITVLNMTPVLSKMHGDAIRTGLLHDCHSLGRVRIHCSTRLTQGRDVVDVYTESQ